MARKMDQCLNGQIGRDSLIVQVAMTATIVVLIVIHVFYYPTYTHRQQFFSLFNFILLIIHIYQKYEQRRRSLFVVVVAVDTTQSLGEMRRQRWTSSPSHFTCLSKFKVRWFCHYCFDKSTFCNLNVCLRTTCCHINRMITPPLVGNDR